LKAFKTTSVGYQIIFALAILYGNVAIILGERLYLNYSILLLNNSHLCEGRKQMKSKSCLFFILLFLGVMLSVSLVAGSALAEDKVTYRLKWVINMSTAGDVFAADEGYFKEVGLAVEIKPGSPESDPIRELEMGQAQFGVVGADQAINALAKGSPLVVVAQLFQVNPLQWMYFEDKTKITSLADLKGLSLGVTFGKNDEIIMRTLLAQAGIKDNQVELYSVRMDYTPFYQKRVHLWPCYINSQGVQIGGKLKAEGEKVGFFNPAAYGIRFVANSVITSQGIMEKQQDMVKRFVTALLKGWRHAMDYSRADRTVDIVQRYDKDTSRPVLKAQLDVTRDLIKPQHDTNIGAIDVDAWKQTEQMMLTYKQIKKPVRVTQILKTVASP
jgi:NitT/TauT family transport system substrate-binding protein